MSSRKGSSLAHVAWALPIALSLFGCGRTEVTTVPRTAQTTTAPSPTAIGGGPRDLSTEQPQRIDPARADRLVEARKEQLRGECYSPQAGVVSFLIDMVISPDGRVESARTTSVNGDENVAECVRGRLEKMSFPQTAEGGVHTFTFLFGR